MSPHQNRSRSKCGFIMFSHKEELLDKNVNGAPLIVNDFILWCLVLISIFIWCKRCPWFFEFKVTQLDPVLKKLSDVLVEDGAGLFAVVLSYMISKALCDDSQLFSTSGFNTLCYAFVLPWWGKGDTGWRRWIGCFNNQMRRCWLWSFNEILQTGSYKVSLMVKCWSAP